MKLDEVIEVLKAVEPISIEGQPVTIEDFKQALISAIRVLERVNEEKIARLLHQFSGSVFSWDALTKMSLDNLKPYYNKARKFISNLTSEE